MRSICTCRKVLGNLLANKDCKALCKVFSSRSRSKVISNVKVVVETKGEVLVVVVDEAGGLVVLLSPVVAVVRCVVAAVSLLVVILVAVFLAAVVVVEVLENVIDFDFGAMVLSILVITVEMLLELKASA